MADQPNAPAGREAPAGPSADLLVGLAIALFGAALLVWIIPAQVDDAGSFGLPPSLAPKALAWVMLVSGLVLAVQNLRVPKREGGLRPADLVHVAGCILAIGLMLKVMEWAGEAIGIPYSGFLIAAPLGLAAFTFLHGRAPLWAYGFNAIVIPVVIYAAFWWGLNLPMP